MNRRGLAAMHLAAALAAGGQPQAALAQDTVAATAGDDAAGTGKSTQTAADAVGVTAAASTARLSDMLQLPLEDLLAMETTSVAKKRQSVSDSAAAVYVITQEDIARSSASTIPELLRLAPGLEVARIQNGLVGVTARGFNSPFANTLLVLIDGRAIYFSSLSGVLWNQQLLPLSEIERIEIVRGPGATLWGSNAVNGVVNIISKHASASRGLSLDMRMGGREQSVSASYNGIVSDSLAYRIYVNALHDDGMDDAGGRPIARATRDIAAGARVDFEPDDQSAFTLQYDFAHGRYGEAARVVNPDLASPGYNLTSFRNHFTNHSLLARLVHHTSDDFEWALQSYINRTTIVLNGVTGAQTMADGNLDVRLALSPRHELNLGLGVRLNITDIGSARTFAFGADHFRDQWVSGYIQDDFWIVPDRLRLTVGSKLEYNSFSGVEIQPSIKLLFKPNHLHSIWAGVSNTARTPSIYERSADFHTMVTPPGGPGNPFPLAVYSHEIGNADLRSERMTAFELGMRGALGGGWTYDLAGYYNQYRRLIGPTFAGISPINPASPAPFFSSIPGKTGLEALLPFKNDEDATSWGLEGVIAGAITPAWNIELTVSHLSIVEPSTTGYLRSSPEFQFGLHSTIDLNDALMLGIDFRHVGRLRSGPVPSYEALDFRLRQRLSARFEISLIGRNLLSQRHMEFFDPRFPALPAYVARDVSLQLVGRF